MSRYTGPSPAVRLAVNERDRYACVVCGRTGTAHSVHHRLPRSRGGDNRLSNLIRLCDFGGCHDTGVEKWRTNAYTNGWLVRTGFDPALQPLLWHGSWSLLTDFGGVEPVEATA